MSAFMTRKLPNRQTEIKHEFAYLALDGICQTGKVEHMDAPNRIREHREAREMTIEELAEATGLSVSYVSRLEKGGRNLSVRNLNLFAHALGVAPGELLAGESATRSTVVPVMGRIGAGAEISPEEEQVPPNGLYEIETPFPLPDGAIAFEIVGDSMWPRYDPGDVIICWRQSSDPERVIGWEAAVRTSSGGRYLKRVLRGGAPGTYDLESHNAPPLRGLRLVWVAEVQSVLRSGQWRRMTTSARRQQLRKMTASDR